jgi:putative salt-induced outer membrane protein YdiY
MKRIAQILAALTFTAAVTAQAQPALPPPPPSSIWTSVAALGLTLTRGNSDTTTGTADIKVDRKTVSDELLMEVTGTYGKNAGVVNAENDEGSIQFNELTSTRFYYGAKFEALNDVIADIHYRLSLSAIAGYYLIKNTNTTLAFEAGPGVVLQQLGDHPKGKGYATLRLAERFEHQFTASTKMWEKAEILPQVDYWKNYYWDAEIGVDSALSTHLSLRTYLDDTYYNIPAVGKLKNDAKLVAAIAYKF